MPADDLLRLRRAERPERAIVGRVEPQTLAQQLLHLPSVARAERRIHRLVDERVTNSVFHSCPAVV